MRLYFLYGTLGEAHYEMHHIQGVIITEFLGNLEEEKAKELALTIFRNRLKELGEDKIEYIFSCRADDFQTNDYEYEDLVEQFANKDEEIALASIDIDEKQYSEVVRQFYKMIELSDNPNDDEFVYDFTFWNYLKKFDDSPIYKYLR